MEDRKYLHSIEGSIQHMRSQKLLKEERALKRETAITQRLRDSINEDEFHTIMQLVKQNGFVASRKKAALFLLYVTGLRVSNLLKLKHRFSCLHCFAVLTDHLLNIALLTNRRFVSQMSDVSETH